MNKIASFLRNTATQKISNENIVLLSFALIVETGGKPLVDLFNHYSSVWYLKCVLLNQS